MDDTNPLALLERTVSEKASMFKHWDTRHKIAFVYGLKDAIQPGFIGQNMSHLNQRIEELDQAITSGGGIAMQESADVLSIAIDNMCDVNAHINTSDTTELSCYAKGIAIGVDLDRDELQQALHDPDFDRAFNIARGAGFRSFS